ncbi:hypothetical protein BS47DRAFT_1485129 [Hydnum rufescens UP504]|uniref:F-box domain-containing protein n=1 Tax=Hydnum rufescens UP504 TaxID=1448309 RepID=A0A9P6AYW2_9AGAM|nr:hypothetical protein BS47DRAFT_1485129 [Hydnum rufescens UP504]
MTADLSLFTLPLEILTRIFGFLEGRQITGCSTVCSYFKHAIENSIVLQYLIKLDMFGYADVSGSVDASVVPATRLDQLERHIDAWNNLDWVEDVLPHDYGFGILCQGILATSDLKSVHCIQLPHLVRGIQLRRWTLDNLPFPIYGIEIDPSNDLLVVVSRESADLDPMGSKTITLHLLTLSDSRPHPRAISHTLFSVLTHARSCPCPAVRVMGCLLGVVLYFRLDARLEIWDWVTGQKMTVLEMRYAHHVYSFEFLSATSIVAVLPRALEVYQILTETPGASPVRSASFCLPQPNLAQYHSSVWVSGSPGIDHRSDASSFPSPSFRLAKDSCYLTLHWCLSGIPNDGFEGNSRGVLFVPLSSLHCSPMYGDALAIPWQVWSKDVYFQRDHGKDFQISAGRLVSFGRSPRSSLHWEVSLFDLNRSRAGRLGERGANPWPYYAPSHVIKSGILRSEIQTEGPYPVHLATRTLSLDGSLYYPAYMICDDEHIVFWALAIDQYEHGGVPFVNKLIVLTLR